MRQILGYAIVVVVLLFLFYCACVALVALLEVLLPDDEGWW
jgi:hypothetical protein